MNNPIKNPVKAEEGDPYTYVIIANEADAPHFVAEENYIGVDAATWFVNEKDSWFTEYMVAGTAEITINGTPLQFVLGQFQLEGGQRIAQIFDKPLVQSMPFEGGPVTFTVVVQGASQDTMAGTLLKQIAVATVTAVAGSLVVETGGIAAAAMTAASGVLVKGVQQALSQNADNKVNMLNGIEKTIWPEKELRGDACYILFHRGSELDDAKLQIKATSNKIDVIYDGQPLRDGAWLVLRIRRSDTYPGCARPWHSEAEAVKCDIDQLFTDWSNGTKTQQNVKDEFTHSASASPTVIDRVTEVQRRIRADEALIPRDRKKMAALIETYIKAGFDSLNSGTPDKYFKNTSDVQTAIAVGGTFPAMLKDCLAAEFQNPRTLDRLSKQGILTFNDKL